MQSLLKVWLPATLLAAGIVFSTVVLAQRYLGQSANETLNCTKTGMSYMITVANGKPTPDHVDGKLCDTLTFQNEDTKLRLFAFGDYNSHIAYDGVEEQVLGEGQRMTITLNKAGTFKFHDHLEPSTQGTFTVTK